MAQARTVRCHSATTNESGERTLHFDMPCDRTNPQQSVLLARALQMHLSDSDEEVDTKAKFINSFQGAWAWRRIRHILLNSRVFQIIGGETDQMNRLMLSAQSELGEYPPPPARMLSSNRLDQLRRILGSNGPERDETEDETLWANEISFADQNSEDWTPIKMGQIYKCLINILEVEGIEHCKFGLWLVYHEVSCVVRLQSLRVP